MTKNTIIKNSILQKRKKNLLINLKLGQALSIGVHVCSSDVVKINICNATPIIHKISISKIRKYINEKVRLTASINYLEIYSIIGLASYLNYSQTYSFMSAIQKFLFAVLYSFKLSYSKCRQICPEHNCH